MLSQFMMENIDLFCVLFCLKGSQPPPLVDTNNTSWGWNLDFTWLVENVGMGPLIV